MVWRTRWKTGMSVLALVLSLGPRPAAAAANPVELRWNELAPLISGHVVQLTVQGTRVRGEVAALREDALVLDVKSTSDSKAYPKGNASIPRGSVSVLRLERERGKWGRSLGTTLGVVSGLALGGYVAVKADNESGGQLLAIFVVITGAVAVSGYFIGRALDSRTTEIRVVP